MNHFHTGLDIKTCGVEGLPIFAAADGYVSRISIAHNAYGNLLFITHPNGYTTTYGHLDAFRTDIQQWLKAQQYKAEKFEVDLRLNPSMFPVKKGELVAFSGNTGHSGGPHLHFEVRETATDQPVNPMLFGFQIKDSIPPEIQGIKIYPMDANSFVKVIYGGKRGGGQTAYAGQNVRLEVSRQKNGYVLRNVASVEASGRLGFAIETEDFQQGSYNALGTYGIELCLDNEACYVHRMKKLDFDLKRFINIHTDFAERMKSHRWFQKSFIGPLDSLKIYEVAKNGGFVDVQPGRDYNFCYYVKDIFDNQSVLSFSIQPATFSSQKEEPQNDFDTLIPFNKTTRFDRPGIRTLFPAGCLYNDLQLRYKVYPRKGKIFSDIHALSTLYIPVNDFFDISIQSEGLKPDLYDKACIMSMATGYLDATVDASGWVHGKARSLGEFWVDVDTAPPAVNAINIRNGADLSRARVIAFYVKDNLSGIDRYNGYIDGKWVLFRFDGKSGLLYYIFDDHCPAGKHTLRMVVSDRKKNVQALSYTFNR